MIKVNKQLKNNFLYKEYKELLNNYKNISYSKEENQKKFMNKFILQEEESGKLIKLDFDIEKKYKEYFITNYLMLKDLEKEEKEKGKIPIFITLTNPSSYHPFTRNKRGIYYKINPNFRFYSLRDSIDESYKNINEIFRVLYKRLKQGKNKDLKYVKVIENHKTLITHLHRILYIEKNTYKSFQKIFNNLLKDFELKQCKEEIIKYSATSYVLKYINKNTKKDIRFLDGYKKLHKIQLLTKSQSFLSMNNYLKIYKSLTKKDLEEIKKETDNLYSYIKNKTKIVKIEEKINQKTGEIKQSHQVKQIKKDFDFVLIYKQIKKEKISEKKTINKVFNCEFILDKNEKLEKISILEDLIYKYYLTTINKPIHNEYFSLREKEKILENYKIFKKNKSFNIKILKKEKNYFSDIFYKKKTYNYLIELLEEKEELKENIEYINYDYKILYKNEIIYTQKEYRFLIRKTLFKPK